MLDGMLHKQLSIVWQGAQSKLQALDGNGGVQDAEILLPLAQQTLNH